MYFTIIFLIFLRTSDAGSILSQRLHYLPMVISVMTVMASVNASGASSFMIQSATRPVY